MDVQLASVPEAPGQARDAVAPLRDGSAIARLPTTTGRLRARHERGQARPGRADQRQRGRRRRRPRPRRDRGPRRGRRQAARHLPGEPGGYGLGIVDALTDRWGIGDGSTRVWFELRDTSTAELNHWPHGAAGASLHHRYSVLLGLILLLLAFQLAAAGRRRRAAGNRHAAGGHPDRRGHHGASPPLGGPPDGAACAVAVIGARGRRGRHERARRRLGPPHLLPADRPHAAGDRQRAAPAVPQRTAASRGRPCSGCSASTC